MPTDLNLTPEQIRYEQEIALQIAEQYGVPKSISFGVLFGVGGATLMALKGRGLFVKLLLPSMTGFSSMVGVTAYAFKVRENFPQKKISNFGIFRKKLFPFLPKSGLTSKI